MIRVVETDPSTAAVEENTSASGTFSVFSAGCLRITSLSFGSAVSVLFFDFFFLSFFFSETCFSLALSLTFLFFLSDLIMIFTDGLVS